MIDKINSKEIINHESYHFNIYNNSFEGKYSNEEMGDYQICFKGYIEKFKEIIIGKGKNQYCGMYVTINNSEIKVYRSYDDIIVGAYSHGISFKDYISVNIIVDLLGNADIELSTNGGYFKQEDISWEGRQGTLFVESKGINILNDCEISYVCNGWRKPIWLFGDSYFSTVSPLRWTSYLTKKGVDNFMLNGYPGRNSESALKSLTHTLEFATPKAIIWCMGMNDTDTKTSMNKDWKKTITELTKICAENNIELILATIPNCTTVNNKHKNRYIRNSGYRYIDFAQAVRADESADWYDSMLEESESPVHPTESGAIALYNEAVTKCPELLWQ